MANKIVVARCPKCRTEMRLIPASIKDTRKRKWQCQNPHCKYSQDVEVKNK